MAANIITMLAPKIIDTLFDFLGVKGKNTVELEKMKAEAQARIIDAMSAEAEREVSNANKQADINAIAANNGQLGWRNLLGWGLTAAAIYSLLGLPILKSIAAVLVLCGVDATHVQQCISLLPALNLEVIMPMLGGLLGLYGVREWGKQQTIKSLK